MLSLMILSFLSTLGGVFCRGYWSYAFTRLVTGVAAQVWIRRTNHLLCHCLLICMWKGLFILGFSLSVEIVGCKENVPLFSWVSYKNLIANFIHIPYALGQAFLTLLAYFFNHWRYIKTFLKTQINVHIHFQDTPNGHVSGSIGSDNFLVLHVRVSKVAFDKTETSHVCQHAAESIQR